MKQSDEQQPPQARHSRRALLRTGVGLAASVPLASWLAACGDTSRTSQAQPTPTATQPAPTATPDTRPITIVITGDVMLGRSVNTQMRASNDLFPFNNTAAYLRNFDLTVGNLECVVSTLGAPIPGKEFTFEANPLGFERLQAAGFDVMSVANNHSGDYGKAAFMDMLAHLPQHNIMPVGGGANLAAAHTPVIKTVHSTTVGFLAYCEINPNIFAATSDSPGHAWLDPNLVRADVQALRPKVDYIIVFTHWGIEYQTVEDGDQQAMAQVAIDAGADFVVGAHPHVRQPSSTYRGKPIVYSLGNFVFDEMPGYDESHGNVLELTLQGSHLLNWQLRGAVIASTGEPAWD